MYRDYRRAATADHERDTVPEQLWDAEKDEGIVVRKQLTPLLS